MATNARVTNTIANVEYVDTDNYRRVTDIIANLEYSVDTNYMRLSNLYLMVEYSGTPTPATSEFGPKVWIM